MNRWGKIFLIEGTWSLIPQDLFEFHLNDTEHACRTHGLFIGTLLKCCVQGLVF